ncbi:MAG: hypothetical protein H6564_03815 [Lewinellaceae bacterium]|nr:hypothetical protein [Lewinellaceae bacterium]
MLLRMLHIALSFLMFVSSTGVVVNEHYCRDERKSAALFVKAEACHGEKAVRACPMHKDHQASFKKKGCCDDRTEYFKSDEEQLAQSFGIGGIKDIQLFLPAFFVAFNIKLPAVESHTLHYLTYKPPIVLNGLIVLLQVFRL